MAGGSRFEQAFLLKGIAIPNEGKCQKLHARRAWPVPSDSFRSQRGAPRTVLAEVPWKEAPVEDNGAPTRVSVPSLPHKIYPPFCCRRRVLLGTIRRSCHAPSRDDASRLDGNDLRKLHQPSAKKNPKENHARTHTLQR